MRGRSAAPLAMPWLPWRIVECGRDLLRGSRGPAGPQRVRRAGSRRCRPLRAPPVLFRLAACPTAWLLCHSEALLAPYSSTAGPAASLLPPAGSQAAPSRSQFACTLTLSTALLYYRHPFAPPGPCFSQATLLADLVLEHRMQTQHSPRCCMYPSLAPLVPVQPGVWTEDEDALLALWQSRVGNKWSEVAKHIPVRLCAGGS